MATLATTAPADNSSLANFQAWTGVIRSIFQAAWTQTSDTGQTNPTTLGTVPAANVYPAYEVYKMGDALQASNPVFIRIDYGTGTSTNNPGLKMTIGNSTNGAGTITGTTIALTALTNSSGTAGTSYTCRASYDTNRVQIAMWYTLGLNPSFLLSIERSHDSTGADTADFISVTVTNYAGGYGHYSTFLTKSGSSVSRGYHECVNNQDIGTALNNVVGVFPTQHVVGNPRPPQKGVIAGRANDWVLNDTPTVALYTGENHTYFCLKSYFNYLWPIASTSTNSVALMRFD